jgi:hypothetical protein
MTDSLPGCGQCHPATALMRPDGVPSSWVRFKLPHDWGLGGLLKAWVEPLWRCPACGTTWGAAWDPYQAYHYNHQVVDPKLLDVLRRPIGAKAVQALLRLQPAAPAPWLLAVFDSTDPALDLSPTLRRQLLRKAGADRNRTPPVRVRRE